MPTKHKPKTRRTLATTLKLEQFHGLMSELSDWRTLGLQDAGILGFVKGLRFSARLIYAIRDHLSSSSYEVDWGHLLTRDGNSCSPECDIIIHKRGHVREWNGTTRPVMNFKFINCKDAVAVISCKSMITSVDKEHKAYIKALKPYVDKIFIFAECCEPSAVTRLKRSAQKAGCKGFWYLYACDKMKQCTIDPEEWDNFLTTLEKLVVARKRKKIKHG